MLSLQQSFYWVRQELAPLYDEREATAIAHELLQHITGLDKTARLIKKDDHLTPVQYVYLSRDLVDLMKGTPLQYVIGQAWFMGRQFVVTPDVLIPRPETEELVQWVVDMYEHRSSVSILDVGSGSGCIPVMLQLLLPNATIESCDVYDASLGVAAENADLLGTPEIEWHQLDFLDRANWDALGFFDVIVSNPPYIPISEKQHLHANVRDHEPELALFVPDDDPLVFYKAIAQFGMTHLEPGGAVFCETEQSLAQECAQLFNAAGYVAVTIKKDMHGNDRMLYCRRPDERL